MAEPTGITEGMTISVWTRRDVVVVDPARFVAAAREALGNLEAEITDVYGAVHALLDRDGQLCPDVGGIEVGRGGRRPGHRDTDRADGLSPAGWIQQIVLGEPRPLQDYGCFMPDDVFARPAAAGAEGD
jgi:hypothetical protein